LLDYRSSKKSKKIKESVRLQSSAMMESHGFGRHAESGTLLAGGIVVGCPGPFTGHFRKEESVPGRGAGNTGSR
jgi:hypothetical protein